MSIVIIASHPDDGWIGCGCTMLEEGGKIKILLITRKLKYYMHILFRGGT